MFQYLLKRTLYGGLVLLGVIVLVFFLFYALPLDPTNSSLGNRSDEKTIEAVKKEMGLDKPLGERFVRYLGDLSPLVYISKANAIEYTSISLIEGENKDVLLKLPYLGKSFQTGESVLLTLFKALGNTIILAISAILIGLLLGILLGVISALKVGSSLDKFLIFFSSLGVSFPSYFVGIILSFTFGYLLQNYTGLNMMGSLYDLRGNLELQNLILPAFALGIRPVAIITQLSRNSMLDVLSQDYIRTARAKGLSWKRVVMGHALKNAMNPIITSVSGWFASLLAGAYFIEVVFDYKGLGYLTVQAIEKSDFPVVMGAILYSAVIFVGIQILVDYLYSVVDPRVKLRSS